MELRFPDPNNIMEAEATITPQSKTYKGGHFVFTIHIPPDYPFSPPKVHCKTRVYHPVSTFLPHTLHKTSKTSKHKHRTSTWKGTCA